MRTFVRNSLAVLALSLSLTGSLFADEDSDVIAAQAAFGKGDYATALRLLRPLAEKGDAEMQAVLGAMYGKGLGVRRDYTEAIKWYRKAAEQGNASAQNNLGAIYDRGQGVPQDYTEAIKWYRKAAEQGVVVVQFNLGVLYDNGEVVPQDFVQAHKWYNLAAANSTDKEVREKAAKNRDLVAEKMTPEQIAEAQKLAREWKPR